MDSISSEEISQCITLFCHFTLLMRVYHCKRECLSQSFLQIGRRAQVRSQWRSLNLSFTSHLISLRERPGPKKEFRKDKDRIIITVNKGVAMVVLDRQDYIRKAKDLLAQRYTYRLLTPDPTNKQKNKLINILRIINAERGLGTLHRKDFPSDVGLPNSMGSLRSTKRTLL